MSQEIEIEGKQYISSKRAAELSGYAQDYIGQLARKSLIDSRRVGGLWYVSMASLEEYKKTAENFKPEPPVKTTDAQDPGRLVLLDGKEYLSAPRAAELSGYNVDYVGQLARSGAVVSQQIGNRWYVEKESVVSHKKEKDALLAAVQSESVGLERNKSAVSNTSKYVSNISYSGSEPLLNYTSFDGDLIPNIQGSHAGGESSLHDQNPAFSGGSYAPHPDITVVNPIPIRKVRYADFKTSPSGIMSAPNRPMALLNQTNKILLPIAVGVMGTIVIVLSVGFVSFKQNSAYASAIVRPAAAPAAVATAAIEAFTRIGDLLEPLLSHELIYQRPGAQ